MPDDAAIVREACVTELMPAPWWSVEFIEYGNGDALRVVCAIETGKEQQYVDAVLDPIGTKAAIAAMEDADA
jgi:hypothetical protein